MSFFVIQPPSELVQTDVENNGTIWDDAFQSSAPDNLKTTNRVTLSSFTQWAKSLVETCNLTPTQGL